MPNPMSMLLVGRIRKTGKKVIISADIDDSIWVISIHSGQGEGEVRVTESRNQLSHLQR